MAEASDWLDPDRAWANGAFIPGSAGFPAHWAEAAARFRADLGARAVLDLPYGADPRQALDMFLPDVAWPRGVLVFVHGGYWMAFGRKDWSHLAAGALARGWACAMPSYRLAPQARIAQMSQDIAAAIRLIQGRLAGPLVVTGHSAGGHLAARMGCPDGPAGVARVVPISPLADLAPLQATAMQADLQVSDAEAQAESPARQPLRDGVSAHVWVGGTERPGFLWQARVLAEAWACPWTVDPGRHHFDVIDGLTRPDSPLLDACLALA